MKRLRLSDSYPIEEHDHGATQTLECDNRRLVLVAVSDEIKSSADPFDVVGLLCHEAVHVWQEICERIGEEKPSQEFQAYSIQTILQELMRAYCKAYRRTLEKPTTRSKPKKASSRAKTAKSSCRRGRAPARARR